MNTKPAIYLTDPAEMLKTRLSQPRVTSEEARRQREHLERVVEATSRAAKPAISTHGLAKADA